MLNLSLEISHADLLSANEWVYGPCGLKLSKLRAEPESAEYGACEFHLNNLAIKFRRSKITPTKTGQFVTLWKRIGKGSIQPFDTADRIDFFIISARTENHFGLFIFPITVLQKRGIVSHKNVGGKRAIRIYPPWDLTHSAQAQRSQNWQLDFFLDLSDCKSIDLDLAARLMRFSS